jgi:hypothetical protein
MMDGMKFYLARIGMKTKSRMTQDTPAVAIREKDLSLNADAMEDCLRPVGFVGKAVDIRYGLGGWAQRLVAQYPKVRLLGYEQDPVTAAKAWVDDDRVNLDVARFNPDTVPVPYRECDLLLADFNTVTVLKRGLLDEAVEAIRPLNVIFTDVACVKLHLNFASYGLSSRDTLAEYWKRFKLPGYRLRKWSRKHHAASTALFSR